MQGPHRITQALLAAMMHSTEPMVLSDPHGPDHPMIAINLAFEKLTGYSSSHAVGRNCRFLQGEGTDPKTPPRIRGHLAAQRGCVEWIVNYRADGTKFWNLLFLSPVFTHDGTLLHYFGNQRDITHGPPASLPDYAIGRADLRLEDESAFNRLLLSLLDEDTGYDATARRLEQLVEGARELDRITTKLTPAPWEMP